tara:strand:- start:30401 stop:32971 length:2571 start_codon:yes stop_codon:yes gene_type:complete
MAIPKKQYMKLTDGDDGTASDIYKDGVRVQNRIKIGDTLKISGTASNNGIFSVSSIVVDGTDVYYVLKGRAITNETSSAGSTDPQIEVIRPTGDKLCVIGAGGEGGGIKAWSTNNTTDPSSRNNGWTTDAIQPTIGVKGLPAKYIYFFIDNALRSCNINPQSEALIKWFGFIQRDQFGNADDNSITAKFSEWQEHPNTLSPPKITGEYTFAYATTNFTASTATNYYQNNRGVAIAKKNSTSDLRLNHTPGTTVTTLVFEDDGGGGTPAEVLDQSTVGEVITIATALGTVPNEYLFCTKPAGSNGTSNIYQRSYGGKIIGTAPDSLQDQDTPILERGLGWNIAVSDGTSDGDWLADTYEFYQTFVYDGNQESLPVQMGNGASTIATFEHTASGGKSLRVAVYTDVVYSGRISGGRIYIKRAKSDDELTLLLDIDIVQGVRSSLTGDFSTWSYQAGKGFYFIPDAAGNCKEPNIDTYTTINGFSNQTKFISIGKTNELYKDVVVANRRAFIVNVRTSGYTGELETFGDRLMFSEINRFDTFLESNFIDVSKGDYGEYVAIKTFADRLIAYKHNLVHIINIASPNPANWYLEDTLRYGGINFKYSATNTKYGIAWVSDTGCYLYDGNQVTNLIERKLGVNEETSGENAIIKWADFINGSSNVKDAMIGYEPMSNSLIIVRSPSDSSDTSNEGYIYDFNTGGWSHSSSLIGDSNVISNFFHDWNNNLCVFFNTTEDETDIKKYLPVPLATTAQELVTRDIDFGDPSTVKKIYAVTITYKTSANQTITLLHSKNGKKSFSTFKQETLSTSSDYDVKTFTSSTPVQAGSIQFKFILPNSGTFEINEMSIEYRVIRNKTVSDG